MKRIPARAAAVALELAADTPEWNGRIVLRGLSRLPVTIPV